MDGIWRTHRKRTRRPFRSLSLDPLRYAWNPLTGQAEGGKEPTMTWNFEGNYYENCSCSAVCPCTSSNMQAPATNDRCNAVFAFDLTSGDVNGTDVSGCSLMLMVDSPAVMADGDWKVGLVIDSSASDAQVEALGAVMSGDLGGPPAALGPLIGDFVGIERHPISFAVNGDDHTVTVGDSVSFTVQQELSTAGDPVQLTGIDTHPAGPVLNVFRVSASSVSIMDMEFCGAGLSCFSNPFSWAG